MSNQPEGGAASSSLLDALACPVPSTVSMNKVHDSIDVGPVPELIMQLCKSITTEQLVSKLGKLRPHGKDFITSVNEMGSQMRLPGFPRSDISSIMSDVLPFFMGLEQDKENLHSVIGNAEAVPSKQAYAETESPSNTLKDAPHTAVSRESQKQPSDNSYRLRDIADSDSDATDMEGPVLRKQPQQNGSQLSDHNENSPSLLQSIPSQARQLPQRLSQSFEDVHERCSSVRSAAAIQEQTGEQVADKQVLPVATVSEISPGHCSLPSPVGVQDFEVPKLSKDSHKHVKDLPQGTRKCIVRSVSPNTVVPSKKRRLRFTALQEEALVYGVMKYGRGNWKEISGEGWFDGRRTTELSDKYRNLEKYGHIVHVKKRVKDKLIRGINPLKELRAKYERHQLQRVVSPVGVESSNSKQSNTGQPKELQGALVLLEDSEEDYVVPTSDDDASAKPVKKPTEAREVIAMPSAACGSSRTPSTSRAPSSALGRWSSESEEDALQESAPAKSKDKKRRRPFTPLEEEALVAGVLKYGTGNWARILKEGGFLGRTNLQLSDKYRNLKQYKHLLAVKNAVNAKQARGEDPLEELRNLSALHWKRQ